MAGQPDVVQNAVDAGKLLGQGLRENRNREKVTLKMQGKMMAVFKRRRIADTVRWLRLWKAGSRCTWSLTPIFKKMHNSLDFLNKDIIINGINKDPFLIGGPVSC